MAVRPADASQTERQSGQQTRGNRVQTQTDNQHVGDQRQESLMPRLNLFSNFMTPFSVLQRIFSDDFARLLTEGGNQSTRMSGRSRSEGGSAVAAFAPKIDVVQHGSELIVRADLPGVNTDDVKVEISDDSITISGERRQEHTEERDGVYRYETVYGTFFRDIPLPEGSLADQAQATFKDGVLEIRVPAPSPQVSRGRRLEINSSRQTDAGAGSKSHRTAG